MYESFYGFTCKPFQLHPDPDFYFDSRQHRRAMSFAEYGLHQGEGFIVITGDIGAGKTTLMRSLLAHLDPSDTAAATLSTTPLDADETIRMVAAAFGAGAPGMARCELLRSLEAVLGAHVASGKRSLLVVDEAQNLCAAAVEELRMLSNLQAGKRGLLQTFLVGQPEFRRMLQRAELHQLQQRVIAACHIGPLDSQETRLYVEHRLRRAGWHDVPMFQPAAFDAIHQESAGVPRRINLLCDRVLLSGYLDDRRIVAVPDVHAVAAEMRTESLLADDSCTSGAVPVSALASLGAASIDVTQQLAQVEESIRHVEDALARIERGNQATLTVFRRMVDWMRARERAPGGPG